MISVIFCIHAGDLQEETVAAIGGSSFGIMSKGFGFLYEI